ncbi:MAG TPA: LLM class flavin-dependent oxidoreductase [Chloroflexia bacterium]|nr:LLM class flavin-dependent oxidoreductase [Chloroflexia bacterium]
MSSLNAGLQINRTDPVTAINLIKEVEKSGVKMVWSTAGQGAPDSVTVFAAAAAQTSTIAMGTSIVPTYPRHPVALASQALVLGALAPGRFRLGIGPSHRPVIEGAYGIAMGNPLEHLKEYLTILRGLLWEGKSDFEGTYYKVHSQLSPAITPPKTPLPVAALRTNAFRLAGEIADGAISWMCPVPYLLKTALPAMKEGAEAAGRAVPALIGHVPVALSTDREAVLAAARKQLGYYGRLPFYARMFADAGYPVSSDGTMTDELLETLVVAGDSSTVVARLSEIQAAGVNEILVAPIYTRDQDKELIELAQVLGQA